MTDVNQNVDMSIASIVEENQEDETGKLVCLKIDQEDARVVTVIFEHFFLQFKRVLLLHHGLICSINSPIAKMHAEIARNCGAKPSSLRNLFWDDFIKVEKAYKALLIFFNDIAKFLEKAQPLCEEELEAVQSIKTSIWLSLASEMKENLPSDVFSAPTLDLPHFDAFLVDCPSKRLTMSSIRVVTYVVTAKTTSWSSDALLHIDSFSRELDQTIEEAAKPLFGEDEWLQLEGTDKEVPYFFDFDSQFPDWRRSKMPAKTPDSGLESAMSLLAPESEVAITPQPTLLSVVPEEGDSTSPRLLLDEEEEAEEDALLGFDEVVTREDESARQSFPDGEEAISRLESATDSQNFDDLSRKSKRSRSISPSARSRDSGVKIAVIESSESRHRSSDLDSRGESRPRSRRLSPSVASGDHSRSSRRSTSPPVSRRRSRSRSASPLRRHRHFEDRYHPYMRRAKPLYEGTNAPEEQLNKNHTRFCNVSTPRTFIPVEMDGSLSPYTARRQRFEVMGEQRFKKFHVDRPPHVSRDAVRRVWRDHKPLPRLIMHDQTFKLASDYANEHQWTETEKSSWKESRRWR